MNISVDPMAAAIDWLDAYRAGSLPDIISLYDASAAVECSCGGHKVIMGKTAIAAYWCQRFQEKPAGELNDLQIDGEKVIVTYQAQAVQCKHRCFLRQPAKSPEPFVVRSDHKERLAICCISAEWHVISSMLRMVTKWRGMKRGSNSLTFRPLWARPSILWRT